jgi:hypothetical protein
VAWALYSVAKPVGHKPFTMQVDHGVDAVGDLLIEGVHVEMLRFMEISPFRQPLQVKIFHPYME